MDNLKNFTYKIVKNFLTKNEVSIFLNYMEIKHRINDTFNCLYDNTRDSYESHFYGDPATDALLLSKKKAMEKLTSLSLQPQYSFWRMYIHGSILPMHKDRPSCEISATIYIGGDKRWPIIMDKKEIDLNAGDAVIYAGCKVEHGRKPFEGDWSSQIFLHYVDRNGPFSNFRKDSRDFYGTQRISNG